MQIYLGHSTYSFVCEILHMNSVFECVNGWVSLGDEIFNLPLYDLQGLLALPKDLSHTSTTRNPMSCSSLYA